MRLETSGFRWLNPIGLCCKKKEKVCRHSCCIVVVIFAWEKKVLWRDEWGVSSSRPAPFLLFSFNDHWMQVAERRVQPEKNATQTRDDMPIEITTRKRHSRPALQIFSGEKKEILSLISASSSWHSSIARPPVCSSSSSQLESPQKKKKILDLTDWPNGALSVYRPPTSLAVNNSQNLVAGHSILL